MIKNPFKIFQGNHTEESSAAHHPVDVRAHYDELTHSAPVFIFMKGTADYPQCGFSRNTVEIVRSLGVEFKTYDILSDGDMREQAKIFSEWATFPQIFVGGEFVGGNDIVTEMYQSGQLQQMVASLQQ